MSTVLLLAVGCSKPDLAKVTGTVKTSDGTPLQSVHVWFYPDTTEGMMSLGKTDDDGNFELLTADRKHSGAQPGAHKVALRDTWFMREYKVDPASGETITVDIGEKSRIDWAYSTHVNSPLAFTVEPGQDNHFDIVIDAQGRVVQ